MQATVSEFLTFRTGVSRHRGRFSGLGWGYVFGSGGGYRGGGGGAW